MATIHANTQLKTGDTVNGLSGLKDCESGRGINLRLDGKAVVPEEWAAPCSPPTISGGDHKIVSLYYAEYDGYAGTPYLSKTFFEKYIFPNDETRVRVLQSIIPNKFSSIMNDWPHPGVRQNFDGIKSFRSELPNGKGYYIYRVVQSTTYLPKPSVAAWPPYIDSELIYDADSGRFKPACAQHDPHLPESLKNERRCLSLCDAEGNCVIIRHTERGIELWQEKYKQRALIDPATGKVLGMEQDNGTAKLEIFSLTKATLPSNWKRTTIGVGETVSITANQAVKWEVTSDLVTKVRETSTSLVITAKDTAGSVTVIAKTECDEKRITFKILEPIGVEYQLDTVIVNGKSIPRIYHPRGGYELKVGLKITLLPKEVNFENVFFFEMDSASVDSGVFNDGKVHCHIERGSFLPGYRCPKVHGVNVHNGNNGEHNIVGEFDQVGGGENDPNKIKNLPEISAMHTDIELGWSLVKKLEGMKKLPQVKQSVILYRDGRMTVSKGNFSKTVRRNDSFEDPSVIQ